jgi:hypothetical protein
VRVLEESVLWLLRYQGAESRLFGVFLGCSLAYKTRYSSRIIHQSFAESRIFSIPTKAVILYEQEMPSAIGSPSVEDRRSQIKNTSVTSVYVDNEPTLHTEATRKSRYTYSMFHGIIHRPMQYPAIILHSRFQKPAP